jgi:signal transduction histidine kinase
MAYTIFNIQNKNAMHCSAFFKRIIIVACCMVMLVKSYAQQIEIDGLLQQLKEHSGNDTTSLKLLIQISKGYQTSNLRSAEGYALQADSLAKKINIDSFTCAALRQLTSVYTWQYKTTEALKKAFTLLEYAEKINSPYYLREAYLSIAYVYEIENDWNKALINTNKALKYVDQTVESPERGFIYDYLGTEYFGVGKIKEGENYLRMGRKMLLNDPASKAHLGDLEINFAKLFGATNRLDSSVFHFTEAINIFTQLEQPYQLADVYQQMGDMYESFKLHAQAKGCYEKTISNYKKGDISEPDYALALLGLGAVALAEKDYKKASEIFHSEFEKIKAAKILDPQLKYLRYMAEVDSVLGNYQEAYAHLKYYTTLYDSSYNYKTNKGLQRSQVEEQVKEKEAENKRLQDEQMKNNYLLGALVFVFVLICFFLFFLYRQKTAALKTSRELQLFTAEKNKELAIINGVKDKLISMIAHDVRSPLTSLQSTLYLTREKIMNEEEFTQLSLLLDNDIGHLMSMLDNTLLWAREQISDLKIHKQIFNLHTCAADVINMHHQLIQDKQLLVQNLIPANLMVKTDKQIILTVFRNLLSNAIKFTPSGKTITIQSTAGENKITVSFKDEGSGIDADIMEKINNREFISTRGTNNEKGTGLGLMFTFDLLSKMGETIQINTAPQKGTEIIFSISTEHLTTV